jgi:predicted small lipoprotein YifL
MSRRIAILVVLFAFAAASLTGCGRKGSLELPPGEEDQRRTYPTK